MTSVDPAHSRGRVRIMLVDDHAIVRQGLRSLIETIPDWTICAEASDGEEALKVASEYRPEVIVLDVSMRKLSGVDVIIGLKKVLPDSEILVVTMHDSERIVGHALRAGARGYVLKTESGEKLLAAVRAVSQHKPYFSSFVSDTLLKFYLNADLDRGTAQLTPRQRQIVKLVAEGNSNKRIAMILKVSVKTVETHRAVAMHKIGARSSADLALYAAKNELVQV